MAFDEGRKNNGRFYLMIDGEMEEVTEEVYKAYLQFTWREKKVQQKESGDTKILSLDQMFEETSFEPSYFGHESIEDMVIREYEYEALHEAVDNLSVKDQALVNALYLDGKTRSTVELSAELGVSHQMISKRRKDVLGQLREAMKDWA